MQELTGASGNFGCSKCIEKANVVDRCKQYLFNRKDAPKQTKENTIFFAQMAHTYTAYQSICGVKGLSPLAVVDKFDYIADCVIDSMHHIYMHVVNDIMQLWFNEEYQVKFVWCNNTLLTNNRI